MSTVASKAPDAKPAVSLAATENTNLALLLVAPKVSAAAANIPTAGNIASLPSESPALN